jgi:hypothetical protein
MRESQYIDSYLDENGRRGPGQGLSIEAYLHGVLTGTALRMYSDGYVRALRRGCESRVAAGEAVEGRSVNGWFAYYPAATRGD